MTDKNEKPSLAKLLKTAIDGSLSDMRICLPAKIISYDRATQTCKAQPSLKRKYKDGSIVDLPIINKIPVAFPGNRSTWIHFDLVAGDDVTLIFSERSLDIWKSKGESTTPEDPRKFNLSDAYAIPGGNPPVNPIKLNGPEGSIEVSNGKSLVQIDKSGKFKLTNGTEEVLDLFDQTLDELISTEQELNIATTNTIFGPMQLNNFAKYAQFKAKLEAIKSKLEGLKG